MSAADTAVPVLSAELQSLVDLGAITTAQAVEASRAAPVPGQVDGFARCLTAGCEQQQTLRPIALRREFMRTYGQEPLQNMVLAQTEYLQVVTEGDDHCPDCRRPCAILPSEEPVLAPSGY